MADRVCPHWVGYLLINPLRKSFENPNKILGPFVQEGMIVLEAGCGMGYFTLPLARMVGPKGRIIAVDIQPKMLSGLRRRAQKAGLLPRIELRHTREDGLGVKDISGKVDFAVALHVVHEVPDPFSFFAEVWQALKQGSKLLVVELKGHVTQDQFSESVAAAENVGFVSEVLPKKVGGRVALLIKKTD
ncbi:MAG: methyltransferase domain-containing protein [Desulfobacteraceae bacterium]|nr:methyltransferase domain-containing protein [Desulfobacteraceae bacterium]